MDKQTINSIIDNAFDDSFSNWNKTIEKELYPSAFTDEYSWLRVKNAIEVNNNCLKKAIKQAISELLAN